MDVAALVASLVSLGVAVVGTWKAFAVARIANEGKEQLQRQQLVWQGATPLRDFTASESIEIVNALRSVVEHIQRLKDAMRPVADPKLKSVSDDHFDDVSSAASDLIQLYRDNQPDFSPEELRAFHLAKTAAEFLGLGAENCASMGVVDRCALAQSQIDRLTELQSALRMHRTERIVEMRVGISKV